MRIVPIPCLSDNYAYLLICRETKEAAIIDASEAGPVLSAVEDSAGARDSRRDLGAVEEGTTREGARVVAILSTHHHYDHVGGNDEVKAALGIERVYGHASDRGRIPGQTVHLEDGDTFAIGRITVRALHVPGHTLGALAYVATTASEDPVVFTGDTLFIAGCGRLFEGDPAMMHASLSKLEALDPRTRVYCGHEYTESNLRFAAHVEPSNQAVVRARVRAQELLREGRTTMGSTMGEELAHNPFLRTGSAELRRTLGIAAGASDADALGAVRRAKDTFKIGA